MGRSETLLPIGYAIFAAQFKTNTHYYEDNKV